MGQLNYNINADVAGLEHASGRISDAAVAMSRQRLLINQMALQQAIEQQKLHQAELLNAAHIKLFGQQGEAQVSLSDKYKREAKLAEEKASEVAGTQALIDEFGRASRVKFMLAPDSPDRLTADSDYVEAASMLAAKNPGTLGHNMSVINATADNPAMRDVIAAGSADKMYVKAKEGETAQPVVPGYKPVQGQEKVGGLLQGASPEKLTTMLNAVNPTIARIENNGEVMIPDSAKSDGSRVVNPVYQGATNLAQIVTKRLTDMVSPEFNGSPALGGGTTNMPASKPKLPVIKSIRPGTNLAPLPR